MSEVSPINDEKVETLIMFFHDLLLSTDLNAATLIEQAGPPKLLPDPGARTLDRVKRFNAIRNFLVSANKALRYASALERSGRLNAQEWTSLRAHASAIKEVRDMQEHDDEYLLEEGRNQGRFVHEDGGVAADATSLIVIDGAILIGNRVHVQSVRAAVCEVYRTLKARGFWPEWLTSGIN